MIRHVAVWLCAALILGCAQDASAADYPDRPVQVILATSPGGTSDIFVRALSDEFQKRTGQPLIVDNRSGGQMNIGGKACADAIADGSTICLLPNETLVSNAFTFKKLNFAPADLTPITNPFFSTQVIVAKSSLGVSTMDALAALSKAKPGTLSYSALSLPMLMFMDAWLKRTGADLVNVPVRGGADTVTGVMTGSTPVAIVGLQNWIGYIQGDLVKPLAVNSQERSPLLPETPTLRELGFPDEGQMFFGFVAPPKTPKAIVDKLYATLKAIGDDAKFRQARLIDQGLAPVFNDPASFASFLTSERAKAQRRIAEAGLEQK